MDYNIDSKETKTINLNDAELNLLDFLVSKRFTHISIDAKLAYKFNNEDQIVEDIDKTIFKYEEDKKDYEILNNLQLKLNETM